MPSPSSAAAALPSRPGNLSRAMEWACTPSGGVALLIAATLLLRLLFAAALGLGIDESYMVAAGRHPQLGYFDHPPIAWWLAWAASRLLGDDTAFVVRLPFVALFALSTFLMYRITARLFGARPGFWAAVALNLAPVFGVTTGTWVLPDGPLTAALLGALACLLGALPARGRAAWGWWLGAGACAGIALCSKYTAVLTFAGAVLYLVSDRDEGRKWLARPHPYAAALLSATMFLPVVVWNAGHGWTSFLFQGGRAVGRFHPWGPLSLLGGEAVFLLPWIWAALMLCAAGALRRGRQGHASWLLLCLAAPPILLFLLVSFWSHVLFHWASPGYLMLLPLLGDAIARRLDSRALRVGLAATATLVLAGVALVGTEVRLNWLPSVLEDFPVGADPDLDAVDWTSLRADLESRGLLARPGLVVAATRWHDAGKIDYALGGAMPVICLGPDPREYGEIAPVARYSGRDVLIVVPRGTLAGVVRRFGSLFELSPGGRALVRAARRQPGHDAADVHRAPAAWLTVAVLT